MPLKNDWQNGDLFTPAAANEMANVVNTFETAAVGVTGVYVSGADRTGATDSLAVLQGIINAAAPGSTIYFPGGTFRISAELIINKPLVIRGGGGMFSAANQGGTWPGVAGTNIVTTSATANGLRITSGGVVIEDIAVVNTRTLASPPTAGSGIFMETANNFRLSRVTVAGFYDCVLAEGRFGNMDSCNIYDPVRYGILFRNDNTDEYDFGDQGISNCNIAMYGRKTTATAAVRWESGGGIRWTGNKIVAGTGPGASGIGMFEYGLDLMVADTVSTVEFMVAGGAISTCTQACIRIGTQNSGGTAGGFNSFTVSGIVFQGAAGTGKGIVVGSSTSATVNNIQQVVIIGNTFKGVTSGGIVAYNMRGLMVGPNLWNGEAYTGPLITLAGSSSAGSDNGVSTQQVDIYRQTVINSVSQPSYTVIKDNRVIGTIGSQDGFVEYRYKRNMYTNTSGWKTMFTIEPPNSGGGGMIEVNVTGADSIAGGGSPFFARRIRRGFIKAGTTGGAITVTTLGTDELVSTTGVLGDANFGLRVVDGGSGKLLVQVEKLAHSNTLWGAIEVNLSGHIQKFSIGAGI